MKTLLRGKFIYGNRIFRGGEVLPDGADTAFLEAKGLVEIKADNAQKKNKREKPVQPPTEDKNSQANAENIA